GVRGALPLRGRAAALERLLAPQGPPVRLLTGEAGVGKTRLAGEVARRASEAGTAVLWGSGHDAEGHTPYARPPGDRLGPVTTPVSVPRSAPDSAARPASPASWSTPSAARTPTPVRPSSRRPDRALRGGQRAGPPRGGRGGRRLRGRPDVGRTFHGAERGGLRRHAATSHPAGAAGPVGSVAWAVWRRAVALPLSSRRPRRTPGPGRRVRGRSPARRRGSAIRDRVGRTRRGSACVRWWRRPAWRGPAGRRRGRG
ncbi:AAA ATPase domain-containing protein, partial [Streptomyces sp. LcepLS]